MLNLVAAVRTAASEAAREATKTSTLRLQTFRILGFGVLGHADEDRFTPAPGRTARRRGRSWRRVGAGSSQPVSRPT